jgi:hypothetical protein
VLTGTTLAVTAFASVALLADPASGAGRDEVATVGLPAAGVGVAAGP